MELRHKRLIGLTVPGALAIGVVAGYVTLTPRQFLSSPLYWAGLGVFGLIGTFMYGTTKRGSKLPRYGKYAFVLVLLVTIGLARSFPDVIAFGFGFIGFLAGLGIKSTYVVLVDTRVAYCPSCGRIGWLSKKQGKWYCDRMGHEVGLSEAKAAQNAAVTAKIQPITAGASGPSETFVSSGGREWFLGGFSSVSLSKKPFTANYGLYATNKRIFGTVVRPETSCEFKEVVPSSVSGELSGLIIGELERRRDFDISKDEILRIELRKSPGIFRMGHLVIRTRSGQVVVVGLGKSRLYLHVRELMKVFYPQFVAQ